MAKRQRFVSSGVDSCRRVALPSLLIAGMLALAILATATPPAYAQTYQVIHTFTGCADGDSPLATLTLDKSGRLYGTTAFGGSACGHSGGGVAFRVERAGSGWIQTPIHTFSDGSNDGREPFNYGGLTTGPDGIFYGTTKSGGAYGNGTVFTLQPPATACVTALCFWPTKVLFSFGSPGDYDLYGNAILDSAGNVYGTAAIRDGVANGTAFQLTNSGGTWTQNIVYAWSNGVYALAGLFLDPAGNLWGTTFNGGLGGGSIFELTPSGSGWTFNTLYSFTGGDDGLSPVGGLVMDAAGNLYGTTTQAGGSDPGGGTVFELSPSDGGWTLTTLCSLKGISGPESALTFDAAGNLYGTRANDGTSFEGSVFKVTHSGNGWTCTDLQDFTGSNNDGENPVGGVALDASGNLYGTTSAGGANGAGVVWEITP